MSSELFLDESCALQIDRIFYRSGGNVILQAIDWYVDETSPRT